MLTATLTPLLLLLTGTLLPSLSAAKGWNCDGSYYCGADLEPGEQLMEEFFFALIAGNVPNIPGGPIPDTRMYHKGDNVACRNGIKGSGAYCLIVQDNIPQAGVSGAEVKLRTSYMNEKGCNPCGSVPFGDKDDISERGELTSNYVANPVCKGVC